VEPVHDPVILGAIEEHARMEIRTRFVRIAGELGIDADNPTDEERKAVMTLVGLEYDGAPWRQMLYEYELSMNHKLQPDKFFVNKAELEDIERTMK
jgi:hypothetical protein